MTAGPRAAHPLTLLALVLWFPTAAGLAWSLARGPGGLEGPAGLDERTPFYVTPEEKAVTDEVMLHNLVVLRGVLDALARGDMAAVASSARAGAESPGPSRASASLGELLPDDWRRMGQPVHAQLRAIADDADRGAPPIAVAERLSSVLSACVNCHQRYRFVTVEER